MSKLRVRSNHQAVPPSGFAERLRALRLQKNLQQKELALLAGVSTVHYGRYERGQALPNAEALKRLADALDVTGDYLLGGSSQQAAQANFEDRELLRLFQEIQAMPDNDKEVVKTFLDAFVVKRKVQTLAAS